MRSKSVVTALSILAVILLAVIEVVFFFFTPKAPRGPDKDTRLNPPSENITGPLTLPEADLKDRGKRAGEQTADSLGLELLGTAFGSAKDPIAFIKDIRSGKQGIYRNGNILKGAKITQIKLGEVMLDMNGKPISLKLKRFARASTQKGKKAALVEMVSDSEILIDKEGLARQPDTVINALKEIKIKPYYKAEKIEGLIITGVTEDSIFAQAGLSDRDIITAVNNQKIDSYQRALQIFSKAKSQAEIRVNLQRNGESKNLFYRARD